MAGRPPISAPGPLTRLRLRCYPMVMHPLDLTRHPPRSPYLKMEGLFLLPRTIDKARAQLPGGKVGSYSIRGSVGALPGLSLILLEGIGVKEERLRQIVAESGSEEEVCAWLKQNADLTSGDVLNGKLLQRSVADILKAVPIDQGTKIYPFLESWPKETSAFEVVLHDDRLAFPEHFSALQ